MWSCNSGPPNHIPSDEYRKTFQEDSRNSIGSFTPSQSELDEFEKSLKKHLEGLTSLGKGFKRNVLEEVHPLEYSLGWFKRRYFGRIDENGNRKIFTEFVFVRCGGSEEWELLDYPSNSNSECWWSAEYDVKDKGIEKITIP